MARAASARRCTRGSVHHALCLAATCGSDTNLATLEENQRRLADWAQRCPWNFLHQRLLIDAELARLGGRVEAAMTLYDQAIAAAGEHGFVHHEALANELAARFWVARGKPDFALLHARCAKLGYHLWGAMRKEAALVAEYPQLGFVTDESDGTGVDARTMHSQFTNYATAASFDLGSALKSALAISSELVVDNLVERVLRAALENAGAERGSLVLRMDGRMMVVASFTAGADRAMQHLETPLESSTELPRQLVQYVVRTRESVVLHDAARQIDGLVGLVEKLLDVSQFDAGRVVLRREELDLCRLVAGVVERLGPASRNARSELRLHAAGEVMGHWDRARLEQVVESLLTNAIKCGAGNPVDVTVEGVDHSARLVVQDRGIGMAAHEQAKIFERYERAVSAKVYGGLGLGLYVSRTIVDAHGGSIRVESEAGHGATFIVELPCNDGPPLPAPRALASAPSKDAG